MLRKLYLHRVRDSNKEDKAQDRFILLDSQKDNTELEFRKVIYEDEEDKNNKCLFSF